MQKIKLKKLKDAGFASPALQLERAGEKGVFAGTAREGKLAGCGKSGLLFARTGEKPVSAGTLSDVKGVTIRPGHDELLVWTKQKLFLAGPGRSPAKLDGELPEIAAAEWLGPSRIAVLTSGFPWAIHLFAHDDGRLRPLSTYDSKAYDAWSIAATPLRTHLFLLPNEKKAGVVFAVRDDALEPVASFDEDANDAWEEAGKMIFNGVHGPWELPPAIL